MSFYLADASEWEPDINIAEYLAWSKSIVIRALYGANHIDAAWYEGARRAAFHNGGATFVGIYHYLVDGQSGTEQAQAFHSLVGAIQPGEVFIADFEEGSKSMLTEWYTEMVALYGAEISPYLWTYSGEYFGGVEGVLPVEWLADYSSVEPSSAHVLWQFSESYTVPGIGSSVDCSVCHLTPEGLAALAYSVPWSPTDWAYVAPRNLTARGGKSTVALDWESPRATVPAWAGAGTVPYPYSYTIQILYASDRKVLETRTTTDDVTSIEIGSIPKGNWIARVWANDSPKAPAGAEISFSTSA